MSSTASAGPYCNWGVAGRDRHPINCVSLHDAKMYCQYRQARLPTESEWNWTAGGREANTAYRTCPVRSFPDGDSPDGISDLSGNVWEWTMSDYNVTDDTGRTVVGDMLMKEIRGGAFDTYFASQATSCFRTGLPTLARVHNVGFRCVLPLPPEDQGM